MSKRNNSYHKFVATAATAALVATAVVPVASAATPTFTDVSDRYMEAVTYLVDHEITQGLTATQFGTAQNIKRVDVAVLLAKSILDEATINNAVDSGFTDVPARAKKHVDALKQNNIVNGKTATSFNANASITRGEAAMMLANAYDIEGNEDNVTFTDVAPRYKKAVAALVDNDITTGKKNNRFGTDDPITRGELAIFLHKLETLDEIIDVKEISITEVNAVNASTIELTGTNLDAVEAAQLNVEGNKIDSLKVNEAGTKATVVFENSFVSGEEQTLTLTEKVEGEADQVTEYTFTYTLEVNSVQASSKRVDASTDKQFLGFTVNNQSVSVKELQDAGYTIAFQSTKNVFESTVTGELNEELLSDGEKFSYKVVITKDGVTVESALSEVEVLNFATYLTSIGEVNVTQDITQDPTQGTVAVSSNKITLENGAVNVVAAKATTLSGATVDAPAVTYTSSNPAVASVNATTGAVTPIKAGTVTITMTANEAKKEVALTVVSGAREASKVTATTASVKLLASKTQTVDLSAADQYGDDFTGNLTTASKDATIATGDESITFTEGKATTVVNAVAKGNTSIEVKAGNKVLSSIAVAVSDDAAVATRKIETVSPSADYKLDIVAGSEDKSLQLVWNQYNADGFLIGGEKDAKYTVSSSDDAIATAAVDKNGLITVNAKAAGTINVLIKEGTVTRASAEIAVVDTTPTISLVKFEDVEDVTTAGALNVPVLKAEGITLSSTEYNAEIASNGIIFVDVDGVEGYNKNKDITLGALTTVYSGPATNLANLAVKNGSVVAKVAAGSEGTIVVRVTGEGESAALATSTINVKVPK